jgi:uncharacterized repeat protein (TIGR03803 family)
MIRQLSFGAGSETFDHQRRTRRGALAGFIAAIALATAASGAQAASFTPLLDFAGGISIVSPNGDLVADSKGVLYGTSNFGGANHKGTVFSLTLKNGKWVPKVLYSFKDVPDGAFPTAGLVIDPKTGALYGTTSQGGRNNADCTGCGTVFKLTPNSTKTSWTPSTLYRFNGGQDGSLPQAKLLRDPTTGVLYGTTYAGGGKNFGTVFMLRPKSKAQTSFFAAELLHKFVGGSDGGNPNGPVIFDGLAHLIGTASREGNPNGQCSQDGRGCGVVFRLAKVSSPPWQRKVIYTFKSSNDGMEPIGSLVLTGSTLYGVTRLGGKGSGVRQGTVYRLTATSSTHTNWSGETILHTFAAGTDGKGPVSIVRHPTTGGLFGLTESGGNAGGPAAGGTLYELTPAGSGFTTHIRHRFTGGTDGSDPAGALLFSNSTFFGTTTDGGNASDAGAFFQYKP